MVDRIRMLCKKKGINLSKLEKSLGFANGSIAKSDEKIQAGRLKAIADYFHVSMEYILTGIPAPIPESEFGFTAAEQDLIRKYRSITEDQQIAVMTTLNTFYEMSLGKRKRNFHIVK